MGLFSKIFGNETQDEAQQPEESGVNQRADGPPAAADAGNGNDGVRPSPAAGAAGTSPAAPLATTTPGVAPPRAATPAAPVDPRVPKRPPARGGVAVSAHKVIGATTRAAPRPSVPSHVGGEILKSGASAPARSLGPSKPAAPPATLRGGSESLAPASKRHPPPKTRAPEPPPRAAQPSEPEVFAEPLRLDVEDLRKLDAEDLSKLDADDLQSAFDRLVDHAAPGEGRLQLDEATKRENAELFARMAAQHASVIRDFVFELSVGDATKQWLDVVEPAATSLSRAAQKMSEPLLEAALIAFERTLAAARASTASTVRGDDRKQLLDRYRELSAALPSAFELGAEGDRREPILVHQLLMQIPSVHKVTIDRIYAAGLGKLSTLCSASPEEIAAVSGIDRQKADAVVRHFRAYWQDHSRRGPEGAAAATRHKLEACVASLERAQAAFQRAEADEDAEGKRAARKEREARLLEINVMLAQLGEVDLVVELERCAVRAKVERLRAFIAAGVQAGSPLNGGARARSQDGSMEKTR